jgi:hypothetical protein
MTRSTRSQQQAKTPANHGIGNCFEMFLTGVFGKCSDKLPSHMMVLLVVCIKMILLSLLEMTFFSIVLGNDAYGTFVYLFAIGFTVISNVLLLNVLIAMFK